MLRNLFFVLLCCGSAAFVSCKDDAAGGGEFRFGTPAVTEVSQTAATVSCPVPAGAEMLGALTAGFAYGPEGADPAEYARTTQVEVSGDLLRVRVTGLSPATRYEVFAFAGQGEEYTSAPVGFTTAAAVPDEPEQTLRLTPDAEGWPNTYTQTTVTLEGYRYDLKNVGIFGSKGIQFKSESGVCSNAEDMGPVQSVELVYNDTDQPNIRLFLGDAAGVRTREVEAARSGNTHTFDCSETGYRYFTLQNGTGVSYLSSITIRCGGKGDAPEPDAGEPSFGAPTASGVTKNSAVVSCSFAYDGAEPISKVWFSYQRTGGAEQQASVTASEGDKSAALSGLAASTTYTYRLCVEVGGKTCRSASATFTTLSEGGGPVPGNTKYSGWAELVPEDKSNSDYHYAYHLCPDLTINGYKARNYTVCFSAQHHCPVWVAAPRHACYEGSANRTDAYGKDPDIPAGIQYNSKSTGGGCNKGHMLGSAERTRSSAINKQVFYYTNIAPQYSGSFNNGGGGWNILEDWIDGQVCPDTTYLVIGTYFESYTDRYGNSASPKKIAFGGRSDVSCPTMFYIAVLRTKKGDTRKSVMECSADELKCAVFVRCHNSRLKGVKVSSKDMISVAELEQLTGHTFFANVPNAPKNSYKPGDWGL